jgi:hypothetical protein
MSYHLEKLKDNIDKDIIEQYNTHQYDIDISCGCITGESECICIEGNCDCPIIYIKKKSNSDLKCKCLFCTCKKCDC